MSRSEIVRGSSRTQTLPERQRVKSEAESQRELMQAMEDMARDMALLTEESLTGTKAAREAFEKSAKQALSVIQRSNAEAMQAATAAHQAARSTRGLRWTMLLTMLAAGVTIGATSLTVLLISQPQLIESLWRVSQSLSLQP